VFGDLDGDGDEDAAVWLIHERGGTGSFFYVAAALMSGGRFHGTNAVLVGDRIAPQAMEIRNGVLVVTFAGRESSEPMTARPSIVMTLYLIVDQGLLRHAAPRGGRSC
jgi:hypothetical protein